MPLRRFLLPERLICADIFNKIALLFRFYSGKTYIRGAFVSQGRFALFFQETLYIIVLGVVDDEELLIAQGHGETVRAIPRTFQIFLKLEFTGFIHGEQIQPDTFSALKFYRITPIPVAGTYNKAVAIGCKHYALQRFGEFYRFYDLLLFYHKIYRSAVAAFTPDYAIKLAVFTGTKAGFVAGAGKGKIRREICSVGAVIQAAPVHIADSPVRCGNITIFKRHTPPEKGVFSQTFYGKFFKVFAIAAAERLQ